MNTTPRPAHLDPTAAKPTEGMLELVQSPPLSARDCDPFPPNITDSSFPVYFVN